MKIIRKIKLLSFILILATNSNIIAQDIHLSQFLMTPFLQNPSFAGKFGGDIRGIVNHRSQWRSITTNPFQTFGASFDMHLNQDGRKDNFFGIGLSAYTDKAGASSMKTTIVDLAISYHIKIDRQSYISAGLQAGLNQRSIDPSGLEFDSQFEGNGHNSALNSGETFLNTSVMQPSVAGGISYSWADDQTHHVVNNNGFNGKKLNIGFSVQHFNAPSYIFVSEDRLGMKYIGSINSSFGVDNSNLAIQPSGFIAIQKKAIDAVFGSVFRYTLRQQSKFTGMIKGAAISVGAHYRVMDAVITSFLLEIGSIGVGFSYDFNASSLTSVSRSRGGFEISLRYISPNPFGGSKTQARFF
jgi:type IX secretion system PorP/SprF family membrane protein